MLVRDILLDKGREVFSCTPENTLAEVVDLLVARNCGSLVVCEQDRMVGIITERDILQAVAQTHCMLDTARTRDHMSGTPVTASLDEDIGETMGVMTKRRIRHLPVLEGERLVGVISIGDVVKAQHAELCRENHYLKHYIQS